MKIKGVELFSSEQCNEYIGKFTDKINECNNKIEQLKADIEKCEVETDSCIEKDIMEASVSSKKELANITARQGNLNGQLQIELKRLSKIREILLQGLSKLVPQASKQIDNDLLLFNETVEKEVYRQLSELKKQQAELLLSLQLSHNKVISDMFNFDEICNFAGLTQYAKQPSNHLFHSNLFMAHRNFTELGSPLLNCQNLQGIEQHLERQRADDNAQFNYYKDAEDKVQLPLPLGFKDIDLEKFLNSL